ncbi:MAG: hypothetical protein KGL67_02570 [Patescibacteria group bacterium]|nr:hypothetical protein [Patescibacteria group bacterium]
MEKSRFVLLREISFTVKQFVGSGSTSKIQEVTTLIPKDTTLVVFRPTSISIDFEFSSGYKITTTIKKFEKLIASGCIEKVPNFL